MAERVETAGATTTIEIGEMNEKRVGGAVEMWRAARGRAPGRARFAPSDADATFLRESKVPINKPVFETVPPTRPG